MAVVVTTTITGRCWKQHTCSACGCVYRYIFERTGSASGGPGVNVRGLAEVRLAKALNEDVDQCPCPSCGLVQPDMVGRGKYYWHFVLALWGGILLGFFSLPAFIGDVPRTELGKLAAMVAAIFAFFHLTTALGHPNGNLKRNRDRVQTRVAVGTVEVVRPGTTPNFAAAPPNMALVQGLCLLAVLLAPLGFLAAPFATADKPLPRNPDLRPEVIAPGDKVTIKMPTDLRSVGGYWRGNIPTVTVLNAGETGAPATLFAATNAESWGKQMAVKDKKDPFEAMDPWIRVTIPDESNLGGKSLRLQMKVAVTYPIAGGTGGYPEKTITLQKEIEIQVADAGLAHSYKNIWAIGMSVGLGCSLLGGCFLAMLAKGTKDLAKPHQVLPLWSPGDGRVITGVSPGSYSDAP
jgi:hypothetical protein